MNYTKDPHIIVGPGDYDPEKILKHVNAPKIDAKAGFTLPFNEKNPLNYVRPITVNIYFKQQYPGVGTYNPEKIQANVPSC
jgi:Sperm-tail PG-rich repeat